MVVMNKNITVNKFYLLSILVIMLAGCSNGADEMLELEAFVQEAVNRAPGPIEPIPEFTIYDAFTYGAVGFRAPFDVPVVVNESISRISGVKVQPDENREREGLENFALGSLTMVGTMARNNRTWALIRDEENGINRVTIGNYLGKNHGRIVSADSNQVNIVEIVPDGDGGWIERPQVITLLVE